MTCSYCGTRLGQGEQRCRRCGRKNDDRLTGGFSLVTTGALAAEPRRVALVVPSQPAASRSSRDMGRAVQTSLFPDRLASNVVLIAPARPKPATRRAKVRTGKRAPEGQGKLEFLEAAPAKPRTLGTTVEARIYCDAPVATPLHRAVAAALDWAMVLIAYGCFLVAFRLLGGQVFLNKTNLMVFGAALLLVGFTYGLLPLIAGTETPGMRWTKLKLTTFDGFPLDPRHRLLRMLGSCLSFCSGVGLLWSLVDEESLTWQDHISRTFPTLALDR
jgi:uncharacterized RDD family membrane protein YckC